MLQSGNGRHRRPKPTNRLVLKAGVAGAGVALPLLGVGTAHAASGSTWDKVADCESGGNWSANSSTGFYGGLQFTQSTWEAYGGTKYAERPDLASKAQQIAVAEKVLAGQGPEAWPVCSIRAGLTQDGSGTSGDDANASGDSDSPSPSASPTDKPSDTPSSRPSDDPSDSAAPSDAPSADPSDTPSDAPTHGHSGGGRHASPAPSDAPSAAPSQAPTADPSGGTHTRPTPPSGAHDGSAQHPSRGGHRPAPGAHDHRGRGEYTVKPGDNLWDIARDHALDGGWQSLYQHNRTAVGDDPALIHPGQHLDLDAL